MNIFRRNAHLPDATLLLLIEGDLHGRALRQAQRHLSACDGCRHRRFCLMEANEQVSHNAVPSVERSAGAARDHLATRLAQESQATDLPWLARMRRLPVFRPSALLRAGIVVALLLIALTWRQFGLSLQDRVIAYEDTGPEPNHALTPGSVSPVALSELCGLSDDELDPRVSPDKERAVFRAYGLDARAARAYQVDYLINPQLGGNDRMENLWPEPYHATVWNARAKDALEARLHGMVCSGQLDLQAAQQDLSSDWIAAYKKYFHAERPVSTVAELNTSSAERMQVP